MDLRIVGYVVAIAEERSISEAARRLRVTQPTLSRQLRGLERRLGAELFVRDSRELVPTPAGLAFLAGARSVMAGAEGLIDDVRLAAGGYTGRLTLAYASSAVNGALGGALAALRERFPRVELDLVETLDDEEMSTGVLEGRYDIAVQRLPSVDPRLTIERWWTDSVSVFLPSAHPLAQGLAQTPATMTVLTEIPLIVLRRGEGARAHDEMLIRCRAADVEPRVAVECDGIQTMLGLVAAGVGAALMPDSYRVLRRVGVTPRRVEGLSTVQHVVRRSDDDRPLVRHFLQIVAEGRG